MFDGKLFATKKKSFPKRIMIQTSSFCNASCVICPYPKLHKELSMGYMSDSLFKKIIDEVSHHEMKSIMLYLMNEPLTDPKLVEKIHYTKRKCPDTHVYFLTNGSLLTEQKTKEIIESPLDEIVFSILGYEKTYEELMGLDFKKTYVKIQHFVEEAQKAKKPTSYIGIKLTETPNSLSDKEVSGFLDFWKKRGVTNIDIIKAPISRAGNVSSIKEVNNDFMKGCSAMWEHEMMEVLYTGQVVLCCMDWKRLSSLGNASKQSLISIWNSRNHKHYKRLMTTHRKLPQNYICRYCELVVKGE